MQDRLGPGRHTGVDGRQHGPDRGAHLLVGVGAGAHLGEGLRCDTDTDTDTDTATVDTDRIDVDRAGSLRDEREHSAFGRRHHTRVEDHDRAEGFERRSGAGRRLRCGGSEIDGVTESASMQMFAHVPEKSALVAHAAVAPGQCVEGGGGTTPELGQRVAKRHQSARVRDELRQPPLRIESPGADGLEVDGARSQAQVLSGQHRDPELAQQLVHGGAVDVDDAAVSPRARRATEGTTGEERGVGRGGHDGHRRHRVVALGPLHRLPQGVCQRVGVRRRLLN
jgi:hypothetical protein